MQKFLFFLAGTSMSLSLTAQGIDNIAEKLGFEPDAIMLILHADDLGVSHSENIASIRAWEAGAINSASIMVPCPWFPEIAAYTKENPGFDLGLHLTLTSEWKHLKWGGVLPANEIPSLINQNGFFHASTAEAAKNADPAEVEKELRAQVQRAISFGINPTHLDSHMGVLFQTPELFKVYQKIGKEFRIPVFIPYGNLSADTPLADLVEPGQPLVDKLYMLNQTSEDWTQAYVSMLENLEPGLNEIIVHLAYDNEEMQAVAVDHPDFGSAWRQGDYDALMSAEFKKALKDRNIKLVTYRQLRELQYPD